MGLGKERSIVGEILDKHDITQTQLCKATGLNKFTISRICAKNGIPLRDITKDAITEAIQILTGKKYQQNDLFPPM